MLHYGVARRSPVQDAIPRVQKEIQAARDAKSGPRSEKHGYRNEIPTTRESPPRAIHATPSLRSEGIHPGHQSATKQRVVSILELYIKGMANDRESQTLLRVLQYFIIAR